MVDRSSPTSSDSNQSIAESWESASWHTAAWSTPSRSSSSRNSPPRIHHNESSSTPPAQIPTIHEPELADTEANAILSFIALLDLTNAPNKTGWTHETAHRALKASRSSSQSNKQEFDFFSHFDSRLRKHLRDAYDRRKRRGYSGDVVPGPEIFIPHSVGDGMRDVVKLIEDAIGTPVLQTREEIARVEALEEMRVENEVIDALDGLFEPTLGESWGESDGES